VFIPNLGSIQPSIQWVLGALSLGVKLPGLPVAEVKKVWNCTSTPPLLLNGMVLS
jgi:hypothetical protein